MLLITTGPGQRPLSAPQHSTWCPGCLMYNILLCRDSFRQILFIVFKFFMFVLLERTATLFSCCSLFIRYCHVIRSGNSIRNRKIKLEQMKSVLWREEVLTAKRCQNIQNSLTLRCEIRPKSDLKHCQHVCRAHRGYCGGCRHSLVSMTPARADRRGGVSPWRVL